MEQPREYGPEGLREEGGERQREPAPRNARQGEEEEDLSEAAAIVGLRQPGNPPNPRMALSNREINLALLIKEAIAESEDVDPVSDFMCAQLALIDGDDVDSAVERAHHLQCFREEYGVLDTAVDGRRHFEAYVTLMPGYHLCFSDEMNMGRNVMIYDNTKFCTSGINSEEKIRLMMLGTYYCAVNACPDFEAIRAGVILICECQGYDWKKHIDLKILKRMWSEIAGVYPASIQKLKYFNSGTMMNILAAMLRPFLPKDLQDKVEVGCQFNRRLDEVYLLPTPEEANLRLVNKVEAKLKRRYENEKKFRL